MRQSLVSALLILFGVVLPATAATAEDWRSTIDADHPLVGRIWDTRLNTFRNQGELFDDAASARHVLLGERHDNPDHHRLQALVLGAVAERGRRPAVVWEMLNFDDQPRIDDQLARAPHDAAGLAEAVDWAASGWPDWTHYEPIARVALDHGLAIRAGGLDRSLARRLGREGTAALTPDLADRIALPAAIPPKVRAGHLDSLFEGHCGLMPRDGLAPLVQVQYLRDAALAATMTAGGAGDDGAVLIAGAGHVRRDVAVPHHLARLDPAASVLAIAFVEVDGAVTDPAAYRAGEAGDPSPFDLLWFTPRWSDEDHCAVLRERLGKGAG